MCKLHGNKVFACAIYCFLLDVKDASFKVGTQSIVGEK